MSWGGTSRIRPGPFYANGHPGARRDTSASADFHGGEVKRYLRLARLEDSARKRSQLLRLARDHAMIAWRGAILQVAHETDEVTG